MTKRWKKKLIVWAPLMILGLLLFIALGGAIVLLLWNWLLPSLLGLPRIGFWQALGILALCRILFGGFGGGRGSHYGTRRRIERRIDERIGERMKERWEQMTPEERERFRRGMEGSGFGPTSPAESK